MGAFSPTTSAKAEWSQRSVRIPDIVTEVIYAPKTDSVICEDRGRNY